MLAFEWVLVPNLVVMYLCLYLYWWVHQKSNSKQAVNHILAYQELGVERVHYPLGTIHINRDARQVAVLDVWLNRRYSFDERTSPPLFVQKGWGDIGRTSDVLALVNLGMGCRQ